MAFLGIRYPFTNVQKEKFFLDLNDTDTNEVKTMILHLILTPLKQRYRMPSFGSNLLRFIFEQNDNLTINNIKLAMELMLSKYIPGLVIDNITAGKSTSDQYTAYVKVEYTITEGVFVESDFVEIYL